MKLKRLNDSVLGMIWREKGVCGVTLVREKLPGIF